MKGLWIIVSLLACLPLLSLSVSERPQSPLQSVLAGPNENMSMVLAEYVYDNTRGVIIDTDCHIVNTSAHAIALGSVYVLGPDGVNSIISTYDGLAGTSVPPLGYVRLHVNTSIPGLTPASTKNGFGVRNVVVSWTGEATALKLTSTIERWGQYERGSVAMDGVLLFH